MSLSAISPDILARAAWIRLMIFDVDGVLTDGRLFYSPQGEVMKCFHALDGYGLTLLQKRGMIIAIISARSSSMVTFRAKELHIHHLYQGVKNKRMVYDQLRQTLSLSHAQCGVMGDDWIDLPLLLPCGFAVSVPHAHEAVKQRVHYVTTAPGGQGAVREVCDLILQAQQQYEALLASYLE